MTPSSPPPQSPARRQFIPSSSTSNSKPTLPPPPAPEPEKEDVEMSEEEAEEAKVKADALAAKTEGSEYYKQRQFSQAASEFSKAWDLWPKDITSNTGNTTHRRDGWYIRILYHPTTLCQRTETRLSNL
jgi:hypothetical protein